jgi:hypothetical protein
MAVWEWLGKVSVQRSPIIRRTASRTPGEWGTTYVYDPARPEVTVTLEAREGLTEAEWQALFEASLEPDAEATVTDNAGKIWSGRILALVAERADGSAVYKASLTLRPSTDEAGGGGGGGGGVTVTGSVPADGAVDYAGGDVALFFDGDLVEGDVENLAHYTLVTDPDGAATPATISVVNYDAVNDQAFVIPDGGFTAATVYRLTVGTGIGTSATYIVTFTTAGA